MEDFEQKVKKDLRLKWLKRFDFNFPKRFSWVGGFMFLFFPFFYVTNKKFNRIPKDASIFKFTLIMLASLIPFVNLKRKYENTETSKYDDEKESIIHELYHIRIFRYGFVFVFIAYMMGTLYLINIYNLNGISAFLLFILSSAFFLSMNELLTMYLTKKYADKNNINIQKPEYFRNFKFYQLFYSVQYIIVMFIMIGIVFTIKNV